VDRAWRAALAPGRTEVLAIEEVWDVVDGALGPGKHPLRAADCATVASVLALETDEGDKRKKRLVVDEEAMARVAKGEDPRPKKKKKPPKRRRGAGGSPAPPPPPPPSPAEPATPPGEPADAGAGAGAGADGAGGGGPTSPQQPHDRLAALLENFDDADAKGLLPRDEEADAQRASRRAQQLAAQDGTSPFGVRPLTRENPPPSGLVAAAAVAERTLISTQHEPSEWGEDSPPGRGRRRLLGLTDVYPAELFRSGGPQEMAYGIDD